MRPRSAASRACSSVGGARVTFGPVVHERSLYGRAGRAESRASHVESRRWQRPTHAPLEPWPGYADLDPDRAADELFNQEVPEAKDQNDQDYALALAAAVANYELVLELAPEHDRRRADARRRARPARRRGVVDAGLSRIAGAALGRSPRTTTASTPPRPRAPRRDAPPPPDAWTCARLARDRRPGPHRLVRRLGGRRLRAALAARQGGPARARRAPLGALRVDGGEGDRPARGLPVDVPRGGRHEPEGRARRRPQVRRRARGRAALGAAASPPARREEFYASAAARRIMALLQPRRRQRAGPRVRFDDWRRWLHQHGPVPCWSRSTASSARPRRAARRLRPRLGAAAATPPRCSATGRTTSCCGRAGAPAGATAATRDGPRLRRRRP